MDEQRRVVIELTTDMVDEKARDAPDVDTHHADQCDMWVSVIAQAAPPDHKPDVVVAPHIFFERKNVDVQGNTVKAWVCEGRAYRGGELVAIDVTRGLCG